MVVCEWLKDDLSSEVIMCQTQFMVYISLWWLKLGVATRSVPALSFHSSTWGNRHDELDLTPDVGVTRIGSVGEVTFKK